MPPHNTYRLQFPTDMRVKSDKLLLSKVGNSPGKGNKRSNFHLKINVGYKFHLTQEKTNWFHQRCKKLQILLEKSVKVTNPQGKM